MSSASNFFENKLIDFLFRGQALGITGTTAGAGSGISTVYLALFTTLPSDSGSGTEVTGGNYSRVAIACNLTNWSGTQGSGTNVASSGTSGTITNNVLITFPAPSADWGTIVGFGIYDQLTGGNLILHSSIGAYKTITNGMAGPAFNPGFLAFTIS